MYDSDEQSLRTLTGTSTSYVVTSMSVKERSASSGVTVSSKQNDRLTTGAGPGPLFRRRNFSFVFAPDSRNGYFFGYSVTSRSAGLVASESSKNFCTKMRAEQ